MAATAPPAPSTAPASTSTEAIDTTEATTDTTVPRPWLTVPPADPAVFDYDADAPAGFEDLGPLDGTARLHTIAFESARTGTVTGIIAHPDAGPSATAVIMMHGAPSDSSEMVEPLDLYSCWGATAIAIDAPFARPDADRMHAPLVFNERDREEWIQLTVDLRRAVDVLEELGAERIAFNGNSYGASVGGLFVGIDDRLVAATLIVGDGS